MCEDCKKWPRVPSIQYVWDNDLEGRVRQELKGVLFSFSKLAIGLSIVYFSSGVLWFGLKATDEGMGELYGVISD